MRVSRRTWIQLAIFGVLALVAGSIMMLGYIKLPTLLFGVGRYSVTVQLPEAGGLYPSANVTYRGSQVGRVESVNLTNSGVEAVLSLRSGIDVPSDLDAHVRSQSAVGEMLVALVPRKPSPALADGAVIPRSRATIAPDINVLLDATNRGLQAIPRDNLKTVIDEAYIAVGGLGPEIARIVNGSTQLAIDARQNLDALTTVIDKSRPVLDSQTNTSGAIQAWAAHVADVSGQLRSQNEAVAGVLRDGGEAAGEARKLVERLQPTLPIVLANLVSVAQVAVAYQPALEQLLVLLPQGIAQLQAGAVANMNNKQDYAGVYLDFKLSVNLPHPCVTGFLPAQQIRPPTFQDATDRPAGLYCRIPQDAPQDVRGARNYPCLTVPGKRAPTVKMCESDEQYVPLNDGNSWKGDPNATLSGQDIPQLPPDAAVSAPAPMPPQAPVAAAEYDPATGAYVGPDGRLYTQSDLARPSVEQTWQTMLIPPATG